MKTVTFNIVLTIHSTEENTIAIGSNISTNTDSGSWFVADVKGFSEARGSHNMLANSESLALVAPAMAAQAGYKFVNDNVIYQVEGESEITVGFGEMDIQLLNSQGEGDSSGVSGVRGRTTDGVESRVRTEQDSNHQDEVLQQNLLLQNGGSRGEVDVSKAIENVSTGEISLADANVFAQGQLPPLFTVGGDSVDFNSLNLNDFSFNTQLFNAGEGDDIIVLPANMQTAIALGYDPSDRFLGGAGDDHITTDVDDLVGLDDIIDGQTGDDYIAGGPGQDEIIGGLGSDTLLGQQDSDIISGNEGNDHIEGGEGDDALFGGEGQDTIDGGEGDDRILGGSGDDVIIGGTGVDYIEGGDGDDVITDTESPGVILAGAGDDVITGLDGVVQVDGGAGTDSLFGVESADSANLDNITNVETISSLGGDDTFTIDAVGNKTIADIRIDGGSGVDGIQVSNSSGDNELTLEGTQLHDIESITLGEGDDTLDLSTANVTYSVDDTLAINLGAGADVFKGSSAAEVITTGTGADTISAAAGDDVINGLEIDDVIDGGSGQDTLNASDAADVGSLQNITNVETINLGAGDDTLVLDTAAPFTLDSSVTINAGSGNDVINTVDDSDPDDDVTINATVVDSEGFTINVGAGDDTLDVSGATFDINGTLTVDLGSGNDTYTGNSVAENITGGSGADHIVAGAGDDVITGGAGVDHIEGGDGDDVITDTDSPGVLLGGAGDDVITGLDGVVQVDGGADTDILFGVESADNASLDNITNVETISSLGGDDTFTVDAVGDKTLSDIRIDGGSGTDSIQVSDSSSDNQLTLDGTFIHDIESITMGDGDDTLDLTNTNVTYSADGTLAVNLGAGADVFKGSNAAEVITTGSGADTISAAAGDDVISGLEIDDVIDGGSGQDTLNASDAADVGSLQNITNVETINLGAGDDTLVLDSATPFTLDSSVTINAGSGNDALNTVDDSDPVDNVTINATVVDSEGFTINVGAGDDILDVSGATFDLTGALTVDLGSGDDTYIGNSVAEIITGGEGADHILAGAGDDVIIGGAGVDHIEGGDGDDVITDTDAPGVLLGGAGDDVITGLDGVVQVDGGADTDILFGVESEDNASLDNITNVETISSLGGDDTLTIDAVGNKTIADIRIDGGSGTDSIQVSDGVSDNQLTLDGTQLHDIESIIMGDGNDTLDVSAAEISFSGSETINVSLGGGDDTYTGNSVAETITGGAGADHIVAGAGDDVIIGGAGIDHIEGGDGDDVITDTDAPGVLLGGAGDDVITGLDGVVQVDGGADTDILFGVESADNASLDNITNVETISSLGGDDTLTVDAVGDKTLSDIRIDGGSGTDSIQVSDGVSDNQLTLDGTQLHDIESIIMGDGNDTLDVSAAEISFSGSETINVSLGGGDDTYIGNSVAETITGGAGADHIVAGAGDDVIIGGAGIDHIEGGDGDDVITDTDAPGVVLGGAGDDVITGLDGAVQVDGGADTDILFGVESADNASLDNITNVETISSLGGDDTLTIDAVGNKTIADIRIDGGSGSDSIQVSDGVSDNQLTLDGTELHDIESITMGDGNDTLDVSAAEISFSGNETININLGGGDDTYTGNSAAETITGGAGADHIVAGAGDDVIIGGAGVDHLEGGDGDDVITDTDAPGVVLGGAGDDVITGLDGAVQVDGGADTDILFGVESADSANLDNITNVETISSLGGDDTFTIDAVGDKTIADIRIDGGSGTDSIQVSDGVSGNQLTLDGTQLHDIESITLGDGDDTLDLTNANVTYSADGTLAVNLGAGADVFKGSSAAEVITTGSGADTISAAAGDDVISGLEVDDIIDGGSGQDILNASDAADVGSLQNITNVETINLGAGDDTLVLDSAAPFTLDSSVTINAGLGNDVLNTVDDIDPVDNVTINATVVDSEGFTINVGAGDDILDVSGATFNINGTLTVDLGSGDDTYTGNSVAETITGGSGADHIVAGAGDDVIIGLEAADRIDGGSGNDSIIGSDSDDVGTWYTGGQAAIEAVETIDLEAGDDQLHLGGDVDLSVLAITVNGGEGSDTLQGSTGADDIVIGPNVNLISVEGIDLNEGDDVLDISQLSDPGLTLAITGGSGADSIIGSAYADQIDGGEGADTIAGGGGADQLSGGVGVGDWLSYAGDAMGVTVDLGTGSASGGDATGDTFTGFENVLGGSGDDSLTGDAADNIIQGGSGDDTLVGADGVDILIGDEGNDIFLFDAEDFSTGADAVVQGGDGTDTLLFDSSGNSFDLANADDSLVDIEVINLSDDSNVLSLDEDAVFNLNDGHSLDVFGGTTDTVNLTDGVEWSAAESLGAFEVYTAMIGPDTVTLRVHSDVNVIV
jgi:Ca2+-binding RTX toxin-like protein